MRRADGLPASVWLKSRSEPQRLDAVREAVLERLVVPFVPFVMMQQAPAVRQSAGAARRAAAKCCVSVQQRLVPLGRHAHAEEAHAEAGAGSHAAPQLGGGVAREDVASEGVAAENVSCERATSMQPASGVRVGEERQEAVANGQQQDKRRRSAMVDSMVDATQQAGRRSTDVAVLARPPPLDHADRPRVPTEVQEALETERGSCGHGGIPGIVLCLQLPALVTRCPRRSDGLLALRCVLARLAHARVRAVRHRACRPWEVCEPMIAVRCAHDAVFLHSRLRALRAGRRRRSFRLWVWERASGTVRCMVVRARARTSGWRA